MLGAIGGIGSVAGVETVVGARDTGMDRTTVDVDGCRRAELILNFAHICRAALRSAASERVILPVVLRIRCT
jgi:hypothetical protein